MIYVECVEEMCDVVFVVFLVDIVVMVVVVVDWCVEVQVGEKIKKQLGEVLVFLYFVENLDILKIVGYYVMWLKFVCGFVVEI